MVCLTPGPPFLSTSLTESCQIHTQTFDMCSPLSIPSPPSPLLRPSPSLPGL